MSMNINMKPDYSYLFSNMSSSASGITNMNFLSDYASIKNGTYGKLMKAYYQKTDKDTSDDISDLIKKPDASASENAKTLTAIDSSADKLKESADKLIKTGSDSLFKEKDVTIKNEDGTTTTTKQYDMDAIYKGVSSFVKNYNSLLDNVAKSDAASITKAASNMTNITDIYSKTLKDIGITVGKDNRLSIDEDKFKAADMSNIKSAFNSSHSFAYSISSQASFIDYAASREATKANTYDYTGAYGNNYSMGNLFNSIF